MNNHPRREVLCQQDYLAGWALRQQMSSLAALSPASVKICFAGPALHQQTCFAGDCCVNKAPSDVQAPFRGVRDQYLNIPGVLLSNPPKIRLCKFLNGVLKLMDRHCIPCCVTLRHRLEPAPELSLSANFLELSILREIICIPRPSQSFFCSHSHARKWHPSSAPAQPSDTMSNSTLWQDLATWQLHRFCAELHRMSAITAAASHFNQAH